MQTFKWGLIFAALGGMLGCGGSNGGSSGTGGSTGAGNMAMGGSTAGTAGTTGNGGTAGTAGTTGNGGTAGATGTAGTGGMAGTAGGGGRGGGAGGMTGTAGNGGRGGMAGTAGAGGSPGARGGSGGAAGAAGRGGAGGNAMGGSGGSTTGAGSLGAIYSGVPWLDTSGNLVNAHGVGFIKVGSTYYMVGEQRSGANDTYSGASVNEEDTFTGVSMYSTTDFVNWTFVGTVVKPIAGTVVAPPYYGERPKILYNASTSKYIIYIKMLNYTGNPVVYTGSYAVLTSSAIAGPYTYYGTLSLTGANDFQVFQDTDG